MQQLNIGQVIDLLEKYDPSLSIRFDFSYFKPNGVHSYRGYYDQLAIDFNDLPSNEVTVADLLKDLKEAIEPNKIFYGYKGGEYRMDRSTMLWVDKYNNASSTGVCGITDRGWQVIINTYNFDL